MPKKPKRPGGTRKLEFPKRPCEPEPPKRPPKPSPTRPWDDLRTPNPLEWLKRGGSGA